MLRKILYAGLLLYTISGSLIKADDIEGSDVWPTEEEMETDSSTKCGACSSTGCDCTSSSVVAQI